MSENVIDLIDAATRDWAVSSDAMRVNGPEEESESEPVRWYVGMMSNGQSITFVMPHARGPSGRVVAVDEALREPEA